MKKVFYWFAFGLVAVLLASCSDDDNKDEPEGGGSQGGGEVQQVADIIVGTWLSSASDGENWITYEFTATNRVNVELNEAGEHVYYSGLYSIGENGLSGSYADTSGKMTYFDWKVDEAATFEVNCLLYDDNIYLGEFSLYRLLSTVNVASGDAVVPTYNAICGSRDVSAFESLDSSIAVVDYSTGEIIGVAQGTTFVTFDTPNGRAAVTVEVVDATLSFAEQIVGTWIYDNLDEHEWQRTRFVADGYVYVEWKLTSNAYVLDETGDGYYTISDDNRVSFTITTPYGMQINQEWATVELNNFVWTYNVYSDGASMGQYTGQRLLDRVVLQPGETFTPEYQALVDGYGITKYASHDASIASVDSSTGTITAKSEGLTYIDVVTPVGAGVVEVEVQGGTDSDRIIAYDFEDCMGQPVSKVHELLGANPYYEDETTVIYFNLAPYMEMVGVGVDDNTGLVRGITVTYAASTDVAQVTSELEDKFIPYVSQTTDTFKAYMDSADRATATVGVTWDLSTHELVYVAL